MIYGRNHIQMGRVGIFIKEVQKIRGTCIRTPSETTIACVKIALRTGPQLGFLFGNAEEFSSPANH